MYKIIEIFDKLKYFIPPIIVIIFHRLKHYKSLKVPVPYSNIYYNKEDLPEIQNDAWSSKGWISGVEKGNAPAHPTNSHHFTAIILANEIFLKYGKFYIFDFGGGLPICLKCYLTIK